LKDHHLKDKITVIDIKKMSSRKSTSQKEFQQQLNPIKLQSKIVTPAFNN